VVAVAAIPLDMSAAAAAVAEQFKVHSILIEQPLIRARPAGAKVAAARYKRRK